MEIIIPVGPSDRLDWIEKSIRSAILQDVSRIIIYDNSERSDIENLIRNMIDNKIVYIKDKRMKKINMAKLRNKMLQLATEKYAIFLDSDVILPENCSKIMENKLNDGVVFTWMHYAYSEEELKKPLSAGEHNPNLGCAGLNIEVIKKIGGFDEKYARDEDVWLYAKLKKLGYRAEPSEGRCLHLNNVHARLNFRSSLKEAKRNLWRSKYDVMLLFDGLSDITFLTGYSYYGSYYIIAIISIFFPFLAFFYIPLIGYGIYYYKGIKRYLLNLLPGLSLAISLPYGVFYNLFKRK
ncbi:glycosyltransferase [Acidianus sulfidivorans JP7]|uniref:Glycosyl transferase family 2 n=1 Tax=Acidianus sulfidivorans JP7 TaxID=619593 RepID=A0A2U9IK71_9CREN|nr:glycosyltransferase family A protein [Acidianus sulfidivorans]AWR96437.1 glycosyltransferase [Acidianus sulfidivorans JP7]